MTKPKKKGRPELPKAKRKSRVVRVCVTPEQYKRFYQSFGADWLRGILAANVKVTGAPAHGD